ncbi:hypothetical protein BDV24DRAFT_153860 [Aspergillus arachidicola]|uniref:Apple domain-containing protein n=1 Tax=Aspergillus arachidicola TaxID=656916 RepID=A0A2G7G4M6_9EURO|nr:hypothetical protein BDV24DRAFT_153860 [Aspergillus arachidicola]PIG87759.1 hypothetical protein AARAC_000729 [Aspergillus arachidicola]
MKFQAHLAMLSLAGVAYANLPHARPEYKRICDTPSSGEVEVKPGLHATFSCGEYTTEGSRTGLDVANPEACIDECASSSGCVGAIWTAKTTPQYPCYLVQHGSEPSIKTGSDNMWITYRKDEEEAEEDPFGEDPFGESGCDAEVEDCKADLETMEAELKKCKGLAARTCTNGLQVQTYSTGSKKYKIACGHTVSAAVGSGANMNIIKDVDSFQECADLCASTAGCARAKVDTKADKNTCQLFRNPSSHIRVGNVDSSVIYLV